MSYDLESLYKSLIKQIVDLRNQILSEDISTDIDYFAWDSRGSETELPNTDLIGLVGWSYNENEGLPVLQAGILVSTIMDRNLFKEVKMLDVIRNKFIDSANGRYRTIDLVDKGNGIEYGQMQITNFEIMPAGKSEVRSTRNIGIELIRTTSGG